MLPVVDENDPGPETNIEDFPEEAYWTVVRHTVRRVFKGGDEGAAKAKEVETKVKKVLLPARYRFYQTEPYDVAADIAGETGAGSEEQWRQYLDIKKEQNYGEVEIPDDMHSPFRNG